MSQTMIANGYGLVEINGEKRIERGFNCMRLIWFLTDNEVKNWEQWHGAHVQAASGQCPYKDECPIHAKSSAKEGLQLQLRY